MATIRDAKEPVRLRHKPLSNGQQSLYLDIYIGGRRSYEFLKLYLVPEVSRADKEKNRQTLRLANAIKAQRIVEIQNGEFGFKAKNSSEVKFFEYFERIIKEREEGKTDNRTCCSWKSTLYHLRIYESRDYLKFSDITPKWVKGFRDYLENKALAYKGKRSGAHPLSQNSRVCYYSTLRVCINLAVKDGILEGNPMKGVEPLKPEESTRMYLTFEEVQLLARTECKYPFLKRVFLFSCLTGLRKSDIKKLTWGEVQQQGDSTRLIFRQKKTGGQEYLDISKQAAELLGERGKDDDSVFKGWFSEYSMNQNLQKWVKQAGITKRITFHCARHTFATMMLDLDVDLYTVSKLLGHREIHTTQIYTRVLDKKKQEAVQRIPDIFKSGRESSE